MKRHFTATAFVVHDGRTLLHWHLLPDEDPATGALREVREETGLETAIIRTGEPLAFAYPQQAAAPYAVLIEDIPDGGDPHQHIDFIYFARSLNGEAFRAPTPDDVLLWASEDELERNVTLAAGGREAAVPEDVRALALIAIRVDRDPR